MKLCLSTGLDDAILARARSQFRRCTSIRKLSSACSGVLALEYRADPFATPRLLPAWPVIYRPRTIKNAVATTRRTGTAYFISTSSGHDMVRPDFGSHGNIRGNRHTPGPRHKQ